MSKIILIMLLVTTSVSAVADWLKIYSDKHGTNYVDPSTLSEIENKILMVDVNEMESNGKPFSVRVQREYDCQSKQVRIMSMTAFRGTMGEGEELLNNQNHEEWQAIEEHSALESLFRFACGKK